MMSEHRSDGKITLEDLLRLKRTERPAADFWTTFDRDLRTRQLAAAVVKRRWWHGLPRVFARYQMPMGAAAVLAVTFLTLREYREPGMNERVSPRAPVSAETASTASSNDTSESAADADLPVTNSPVSTYVVNLPVHEVPVAVAEPRSRSRSNEVDFERVSRPEPAGSEIMTPSARSIAANLAAVQSELVRTPVATAPATLTSAVIREPLAQVTSPQDVRRERLFAYNDAASSSWDRDLNRATERIGSRISETELYDTVRRLSGGGNHLTLKF